MRLLSCPASASDGPETTLSHSSEPLELELFGSSMGCLMREMFSTTEILFSGEISADLQTTSGELTNSDWPL